MKLAVEAMTLKPFNQRVMGRGVDELALAAIAVSVDVIILLRIFLARRDRGY